MLTDLENPIAAGADPYAEAWPEEPETEPVLICSLCGAKIRRGDRFRSIGNIGAICEKCVLKTLEVL